ncbi:MAG TPA: bifunctional UDP-N-acetylglucosamine diphosphorylase/glucosamine-1-phosphate N-acetyltransferase GlmU [Burkholderiaceae bacterium]|nr:bifunctional UDP-N-acetylglucosamine diphosphorylase/glucosamine-1-phosphate N-acetyltransferase GlmU [Burkholderiaceae bacterium]
MNVTVLAAGMGKRMRSDLPKVLHALAGRPLLGHVLDTARGLSPGRIVVVHGHGGERVVGALDAPDLGWARQEPQLGTGHAVMQAVPQLDDDAPTLILYGDVPLTRTDTLRRLVEAAGRDRLGLLTVELDDPTGYGRIVRGPRGSDGAPGPVERIVEHKDADAAVRAIREVNTGIMVAPTRLLKRWLADLSNDNAQGEYYLTDVVAMAVAQGVPIVTARPDAVWETLGVNSKAQLAELERIHQRCIADALLEAGVGLADPSRIDVRGRLVAGRDCFVDVGCVFEGEVVLGDGVTIGANCVVRDARIGDGAQLLPMTHVDSAVVGARARIGPYARLRPGTVLDEDTHVGNFVELKATRLGAHSKANHLAYVGDAEVGRNVNIGAGTITCNYDGANKHRTVIEDDAFIGSDSQLVAPVVVGRGATLGAGTTLTRDAPAGQLTVSRAKQVSVSGWTRPVKAAKPSKE